MANAVLFRRTAVDRLVNSNTANGINNDRKLNWLFLDSPCENIRLHFTAIVVCEKVDTSKARVQYSSKV